MSIETIDITKLPAPRTFGSPTKYSEEDVKAIADFLTKNTPASNGVAYPAKDKARNAGNALRARIAKDYPALTTEKFYVALVETKGTKKDDPSTWKFYLAPRPA